MEGIDLSINIQRAQSYRPYKIDIYGLQDNYIGTLQSYNDHFIGRIRDPELTVEQDGTQTFSCQIPKFYIDPLTNSKIINPRWGDVINGVLAEDTRVLKVFVEVENKTKVYPFLIEKIVDKRDEHFAVYKEISGSGLAFSELGKVGYKLELTQETALKELEKNPELDVETLDYWLDKVFPNEKDENGNIITWLTPWCYEVRMDWSHCIDANDRLNTKVYDDAYVSSWAIDENSNEFIPVEIMPCREKARAIDCVNSNKYNITQSLAEAFEIFCRYEYTCSENGQFLGEYIDENGKVWRGRKVVFYNRAIKNDNPLVLDYQRNLQTISRTCDSSEIYSKLYVTPVESANLTNGYLTIADATANPLMEDYILNFDYLYEKGSVNDYQMEYIAGYEKAICELNQRLKSLSYEIDDIMIDLNLAKAETSFLEKQIASAEEELVYYEPLRNSEVTNTPVQKNETNQCSVIFVPNGEILQAQLRFEGVAAGTIMGYTPKNKYKPEGLLFSADELIPTNEIQSLPIEDPNIYLLLDEYGYPVAIYAAMGNPRITKENIVYLALEYAPKNKYTDVCKRLNSMKNISQAQKRELDKEVAKLEEKLNDLESQQEDLLLQKNELYQKFELILGPALREGYWTPETNGEGAIEKHTEIVKLDNFIDTSISFAQFAYDKKPFEQEETGYYYTIPAEDTTILGSAILGKLKFKNEETYHGLSVNYYSYLDISSLIEPNSGEWYNANLNNLVVHLQNPNFTYIASEHNALQSGKYYLMYNGNRYYFTIDKVVSQIDLKVKLDNGGYTLILETLYKDGTKENIAATSDGEGYENASNQTSIFGNIKQFLGDYCLYPDAGFIFSFVSTKEDKVIPVLLFNSPDIPYDIYSQLAWTISDGVTTISGIFDSPLVKLESFTMCYPRIVILADNVNYDSDLLKILVKRDDTEVELVKYTDYQILVRHGQPYFTLKVTDNNTLQDILYSKYKIIYQVSHANELLYLDAKNVAKDNSHPRFEYTIDMAQIPDNIEDIDLGQLVYINDFELGAQGITGYITKFTLKLDKPSEDSLSIQNYKTKFEDLFETITAQSEAMKQNKISYDLVVNNFEGGIMTPETLQTALGDADLSFNFSNTKVSIDDVQGILLTNEKAYSNGVFGQVAMQGGGIYLSNTVNPTTQERIWNTAITPNGINASVIKTGQLDTSLVRVFSGNEIAFQWNSEGIFAYKNIDGILRSNTYVKYSQHGLQYVNEDVNLLSLDWDGLTMYNKNGTRTFFMDRETGDLTMDGIIQARGGTIGGLQINPDSLGSGTGVQIEKNSVSIKAGQDNYIFLDKGKIELNTKVEDNSALIVMDKNGILLEAASSENVNQLNLTSNFITFGSDSGFSVSSTGVISGSEASFDKLIVNGYPVNANTIQCVVASGDVPPEGHNFLWFKPYTYQAISAEWGNFSAANIDLNYNEQEIRLPLANKDFLTGSSKFNYTVKFRTYLHYNSERANQDKSIQNIPVTATLICNGVEVGTNTQYVSLNAFKSYTPIFTFSSKTNVFSEINTNPTSQTELVLKVTAQRGYTDQFKLMHSTPISISAHTTGTETANGATSCEIYYIP